MSRPESLRRSASKAAASGRRTLFAVCLAVALAVIASGLWREAQNPRFAAKIGTVSGLAHESREDVIATAAIGPEENAWLVNRRAVESRIETLPWVGRAKVSLAWPNVVSIQVTERSPIARVELARRPSPEQPRAFALVDGLSRVLAVSTNPAQGSELPAISVDPTPDAATHPGESLAGSGVAQALAALRELRGRGVAVTAVTIDPSTGIGATADRNLRVLFGDDDDLARKASLFLAIAAKISTPERIAYVDVRSVRAPTVLYR